eukprot:3524930-Prymnesium_polylepis.1
MAQPKVDADTIDTTKPHWWRRLPEADPISLEPLRRLRYEPFGLRNDDTHQCWFDAKVLRTYLVSTGQFIHPMSRRELTRDDCEALDTHIRKHKLGDDGVVYAFDNKEDYKKKDSPENRVQRMQQEADTLLRSLYSGITEASSSRRGGRDGAHDGAREAASAPVAEEEFEETVPLGGAELHSTEHFPTLYGDDAPAPTAPAVPLTTITGGNWSAAD